MLSPRRAAHALLLTVAVGALVAVPATPAAACSCVAITDAQARKAADAVFFGEVVQRRDTPAKGGVMSSADRAVYVVQVSRVYKGRASATQEVVTARSGGTCGLELPARGPALFFAFASDLSFADDGGLEPGQLSSNLCSGTRSADSAPASFGPGTSPIAAAAGDGTPTTSRPDASGGPQRRDEAAGWLAVALVATVGTLAAAGLLAVRRTRSRGVAATTDALPAP